MKSSNATRLTLTLIGLAVAGVLSAQSEPTDFPNKRTQPATCDDFNWHADMLRDHPRVVDACQEAVNAEGETWARLAARFVKVQPDGLVVFSVRDKRDREIDEVAMEPAPGQVAYINDRATEFDKLTSTDSLSLYVPEGQYGYATRPAVATERFVRVAPPIAQTPPPPPPPPEPVYAAPSERAPAIAMNDRDTMPARLPDTAGLLPWFALGGSLLLFAALTLALRRKL